MAEEARPATSARGIEPTALTRAKHEAIARSPRAFRWYEQNREAIAREQRAAGWNDHILRAFGWDERGVATVPSARRRSPDAARKRAIRFALALARSAGRESLVRLAVALARRLKDAKLEWLVALAVNADLSPSYIGGRLASPTERRRLRAERRRLRVDHWARVWVHLQGKPVLIMGSSSLKRGAWVRVRFRETRLARPHACVPPFGWLLPPGQRRRPALPVADCVAMAACLAGKGRLEVAWGAISKTGKPRARRVWRLALPPGRRAARVVARKQLDAALREAYRFAARLRDADAPKRIRLDTYLRHLVAYLLRTGSRPTPWPRAVERFRKAIGMADDDDALEAAALALRDHYRAARRLVGGASSPGRRAITA